MQIFLTKSKNFAPSVNFSKLVSGLLVTILFFSMFTPHSFAAINPDTCTQFKTDMGNGDPPSPLAIICVIDTLFYYVISAATFVLVIIIAYGAWKSSLAFGDPKMLDAAKKTWTYGLVGFMVVIGFMVIINVILSSLGLSTISPGSLLAQLEIAIRKFLVAAKITSF